jgi:hypothetical protein
MRKLIVAAVAVAAAAVPALTPALASANVPRCQVPVAGSTATFTVTSPVTLGDWSNVWNHDFTVTVQPDGSFVGTDLVYNGDPSTGFIEQDSGTFNSDGTISLNANRPFDYVNSWSLDHAKTDGSITDATTQPTVPWTVEMKVTPPAFNLTDFRNHGQYVSSQGGGKDAAQSCVGMPLNSAQGQ